MLALNSGSLPIRFGDSTNNATALSNFLPDALSSGYSAAVLSNVEKAKNASAYAGLPTNLTQFFGYAHVARVLGEKNNPIIMGMAQELADHKGVPNTFKDDGPWCALFVNDMGFKLFKEGTNPGFDYPADFSHEAFPEKFGPKIEFDDRKPGDFYFFYNPDNANDLQHAGRVVKEDSESYYLFGGNQGESEVSITKIPKKDKNGVKVRPREIRRWPGSDGTASIKWEDDAALNKLLDTYNGKPVESAPPVSTQNAASSDAAAPSKKIQDKKPKGNSIEISVEDMTRTYKVGMVLADGSTVTAIEKVSSDPGHEVKSTFSSAPILKITIKAKDGQISEKYCEPGLDLTKTDFPNKSKAVEGNVKIDAAKSSVMQKMADTEKGDAGKVTWQGFKALLEESGKLVTEEGLKLQLYKNGVATGQWITTIAKGYCEPERMSGMTTFRYAQWEQILSGIGLGKYAKMLTPSNATFENGMGARFDEYVPKLMALIKADHPEAKTEYEALVAATKSAT
jgi:hypothetical protein